MKKLMTFTILFLALIVPQYAKCYEFPLWINPSYISATGACNIIYFQKEHHKQIDLNAGYFLGAAIGYCPYGNIRVEAEFGYRNNQSDKYKFKVNAVSYDNKLKGRIQTFSGLANVYYDFPVCILLKPYVGAGGGYAYSDSKIRLKSVKNIPRIATSYDKNNQNGFAWQVIAGVLYPICLNTSLAFEYRFFRCESGQRFQNHDVGINLIFGF